VTANAAIGSPEDYAGHANNKVGLGRPPRLGRWPWLHGHVARRRRQLEESVRALDLKLSAEDLARIESAVPAESVAGT